MVLREYQQEAVDALWNELFYERSALCVLPTGCGKTEIFIELMKRSILKKPDIKIVVLVNKITLLDQTQRRLARALGLEQIGVYCGSKSKYSVDATITVATIQSIHSIVFDSLNLLILDECHNVDQESGRFIDFIHNNWTSNEKMKVVAFTATPFRASGGFIYGEGKIFSKITYRRKLQEMIDLGFLVRPRIKRVEHQFKTDHLKIRMGEFDSKQIEELTSNEAIVLDQIKDALPRMLDRSKIVWACATIFHCKMVARLLYSLGEKVSIIHSKLSSAEREYQTALFETANESASRHLVFVTIVSEGYDFPPIDCVCLMRPIRSPVLYVQTVGRGLRLSPGKTDLLVLDYGKVVESCGPLDEPILATDEKAKAPKTTMKFCPTCLDYVNIWVKECTCGHLFETDPKIPRLKEKPDELSRLLSSETKRIEAIPIREAYYGLHTSKNNNRCLVVIYRSQGLFGSDVKEYFVVDKPWGLEKARNRLMSMGITDMIVSESLKKVQRPPSEITVEFDRFPKVLGLKFE